MSQLETASRGLIEAHQLARLQLGITRILPHNGFYQEKLFRGKNSITLDSLKDLIRLPFTTNDHAGLSEMGAYGYACSEQQGLHVNEGEFIAEILDLQSGQPVEEGQTGELVLTNLGRWGSPALRYRTGDLVRHGGYSCRCGRTFLMLTGGVLGRVDDMLIVRGVNVYPSALADVLHGFPEVAEYKIIVTPEGAMDEIALQVECPPSLVPGIQEELRMALNLRIPVEAVEQGVLPRFELKARRVEDRRHKT